MFQIMLIVCLSFAAGCSPAAPKADSPSKPAAPSEPAKTPDTNTTSAAVRTSSLSESLTETLYTQKTDAEAEKKDENEVNAIETEGDNEAPTMNVGDAAPAVSIAEWAHGNEIGAFKKNNVYVIEFWATWCPPCRDSMPHLSKLAKEYGERVQFLGVTDEDAETVKKFLESRQSSEEETKWSEVVTYSLGLDKDKATMKAYMLAARQSGIPTAFIVGKDSSIEWIGHPMEMDEPLRQVVDGSWNRAEFA